MRATTMPTIKAIERRENASRATPTNAPDHAVDERDDTGHTEERSPAGGGDAHVGEHALHVVITAEREVTRLLARQLEVVAADAVDRLCVGCVLDARLDDPHEGHRAQEEESRQDEESKEAEVGDGALALRDERERDETRGKASEVNRRASKALGDRRRASALQGEVLRRQRGQQRAALLGGRIHGQTA
jgi:hypothetical protein